MKFSVCIESVFEGMDCLEAIRELAKTGHHDFEFWFQTGKDAKAMKQLMDETGMHCRAMACRRVSLVNEKYHAQFLEMLKEEIAFADIIDCPTLIFTVGDEETGISYEQGCKNIVKALKTAVPLLKGSGKVLALEPLNTEIDHPGHFMASSDDTVKVIEEVGSADIKMLFDIYHQQISEGNLSGRLRKYAKYLQHIHCAGHPGRHELELGEIRYEPLFELLDEVGYQGYIGLEYWPTKDPIAYLVEFFATHPGA